MNCWKDKKWVQTLKADKANPATANRIPLLLDLERKSIVCISDHLGFPLRAKLKNLVQMSENIEQ